MEIVCMQGNFACLFSSAKFFIIILFKKKILKVSNYLDPGQTQHFVWPDCSTQLSNKFQLLIESKILKNKDFFLLSNSWMMYLIC